MTVDRILVLSQILGRPYIKGGQGPDVFDCYGAARTIQREIFGRDMPAFTIPGEAGRWAIASAITAHPERAKWREIERPVDGALVTMARNIQGYHIGTWLDDDDGLIVHAIETVGVVASRLLELEAEGWRKFRFHIPVGE